MRTIDRLLHERRYAFAAAVALGAVDVVTTIIGLSILPSIVDEVNPAGQVVWAAAGPAGLVLVKGLSIVGLIGVLLVADWFAETEADPSYSRGGHLMVALAIGYWIALAVNNTGIIVGAIDGRAGA